MTDFEMMHVSQAACKTLTFLLLVSLNLSAWLIVLTTIDRFVAVWLPLRAITVCRHRRACLTVIILIAIVSAFNIHAFWTTELRFFTNRRSPMCMIGRQWIIVFECMKLASYSVVPFLVILFLNCAIILRLRLGRSALLLGGSGGRVARSYWSASLEDSQGSLPVRGTRHSQRSSTMLPLTNVGSHQQRGFIPHAPVTPSSSRSSPAAVAATHSQSKVTYMLLVVSVTWLILTAPWTLRSIVAMASGGLGDDPRGVKQFVTTVSFLLMYINHAINFYLYCVTGRKFRRELHDMLAGMCIFRRLTVAVYNWFIRMFSCCGKQTRVERSISDCQSEMRAFNATAINSRHGKNIVVERGVHAGDRSHNCDVALPQVELMDINITV